MTFPELPETSKMWIFTSIVHHLPMNNVNIYVSKIYPSGLIFGRGSIGLHIWGAYIPGGLYKGGVLTGFYGI